MLRGENFRSLSFGSNDGLLPFDSHMLESSAERCTKLKCFDFGSGGTANTVSWIEGFGKQMEKLSINSGMDQEMISAIPLHCTDIRELSLWQLESEHRRCEHMGACGKNCGKSKFVVPFF